MAEKLTGIFTPTLVPIDARGQINEAELRRFVSWLIASGVHGLYPNGSTGEFTRFNEEERRQIVRITCDEARGRVPILAGAAEANVKETLSACEAYAAMGARAVAIVSPIYYRLSPESVYAYFAEIARYTPIDITLYNIPMFASPIDVPTIRRLAADFPRVIGIKDSSGDLAFMMRMIAAIRPIRPDFTFLTGWEAVLAPMLMVGCDGGTNASSNAVPEVTRRIYELCRAGNYEEAMKWNYRIIAALRHHALSLRISRRVPRRRLDARLRFRQWPPASDRRAEDRPRRDGQSAAMHPGRFRTGRAACPKAAPCAPASRPRTSWSRWYWKSCTNLKSGGSSERRAGPGRNRRLGPRHGGARRHGEDGQCARAAIRTERSSRRVSQAGGAARRRAGRSRRRRSHCRRHARRRDRRT